MLLDLSYINVYDLLVSTGIKNISVSGGEASFSCPSEAHLYGDRNPSARMNVRTTAFICHNCGWRGNAISFLSRHKRIPETKAKRLLEERYGGGLTAPIDDLTEEVERIMNEPVELPIPRRVPDEDWIRKFKIDWDEKKRPCVKYLVGRRGFHPLILDSWELGWDKSTERITIPIRNENGKLVGFKGRSIDDDSLYPRYMILGDSPKQERYGFDPYHKSEVVYGLHTFKKRNDTYPADPVVIVEGELNVIAMDEKGFKAIGVAGSEFSDIQAELIYRYCEIAIIYFDNDPAGWKGTRKVIEKLSPMMEVRAILNAPGDAADLSPEEIKDLVVAAEPALLLAARGDL